MGFAQLDPKFDVDIAVDQLVGPIYYRVLVAGESVAPAFTDRLVDEFLTKASIVAAKCTLK